MTYLFENDSQRELSTAKKGDKFVVLTTKGQLDYSTVIDSNGSEIIILHNNSQYTLVTNSSIKNDKLSFKDENGKWLNIKFQRIYIKHAADGKVTVIEPLQKQTGGGTKDMDPEFKENLAKQFLDVKETIGSLTEDSKLHITYGTHEFDKDGNYLESATKTTDLTFLVSDIDGNQVELQLLHIQGYDDALKKFIHKKFVMEIDRDLFELTTVGITMELRHSKGRVVLNCLIGMDVEEKTKADELLSKEVEESRKKFAEVIYNCKRGDTFTIKFGDKAEGVDGKYEIDEGTASYASFKKLGDLNKLIYTKLVDLGGPLSQMYEKFQGEYVYFRLDEKLFTFDDAGVIINAIYLNQEFSFEYVFQVQSDNMSQDNEDDLEDIDKEKDSKLDSIGKNKDLMRLLHHRSWRDRLMGRDGVGIIPTDDVEKKMGINQSSKGVIQFKLLSDDISVGSGKNLYLKKGVPVTGRMFSSGRIIYKSRNNHDELHLFAKSTKKRDIYDVKIVHVDGSNGVKNNLGTGRIEILS